MKQIALILLTLSFLLSIHAQETMKTDPELKNTFHLRYETNDELNTFTENQPRKIGFGAGSPRPANVVKAVNLNNIGADFFLKKDYKEAIKYFRQAEELLPEFIGFQINLANALVNEKHYDEAVVICRKLIGSNVQDGRIHAIFGDTLYELGKYSESVSAYRKALELMKPDAIIFNNLGNTLYQLGDNEAALSAFENALKIKPIFPDALNNYGVTLGKLKRYKEAVQKFQKAIKQQPDFAKAHNHLGSAYFILGKKKQAQKSYLDAVRLNPEWSYARYNLAMSYLDEGKREEARQCLEILQKLDTELAQRFQKEFYKNYVIDVSGSL